MFIVCPSVFPFFFTQNNHRIDTGLSLVGHVGGDGAEANRERKRNRSGGEEEEKAG